MMDRELLLQLQFPERYVAGQLTPAEVEEFEARMLEDPELQDHVEAARVLKLGLRTLSERGQFRPAVRSPRQQTWWLLAACLAVVSAGLYMAGRGDAPVLAASLQELSSRVRGHPVAGEIMLVRTRGERVEIRLPAEPAAMRLRVVVSPGKTGSRSATLVCEGKRLTTVSGLETDAQSTLTLFLDGHSLPAGDCELLTDGSGEQESFPIRFVRGR
jgi:hypothetical protein